MKVTYGLLFLLIIGHPGFSQVKMKKAEGGFLFTENQKEVLFFQTEPKNKEGQYERCNYIHPLWGIKGNILTEDFPADHLHQRGVFWAWHQIWIGDKRIGDGWELKDFEQQLNEVEYVSDRDGSAVFKTEVAWKSDKWKRLGEKIPYLKENTTITIHPEKSNYRKIDFEIHLLALAENLSIGGSEDEKGYSGFSVRMLLPEDVIFSGPGGELKPEVTQVESKGYVNISGSVGANQTKGGLVIVDNPDNPGYPQKWILRDRNSMQNAAFPGNKTIPVSTTESLVLKYSLIVYSGKMNDRKIQKIVK
ncbi:DUF6807 domain-containing protein [Maribellus maritimus]|uniref:DUF6807 domain-containing protein n=1 Tax=Maribellus maritimus TaxID=2870838 RepID=UPI001EEAEA17|nr:PmoA family protein [Maribellus maritimus]MCG6189591.1 PmoA family protein [Maribellus maritimus]